MVVIRQARRAAHLLADAPFLLAAAVPLLLVGALQLGAQSVHSLAYTAAVAVTFLASPFLSAGLLGSVADALEGTTPSWSRWLAWGRERYLALLLAQIGVVAVAFALGFGLAVVAFVLGSAFAILVGLDVGAGGVLIALFALLGVLLLLAYVLLLALAFAYYTAAVVVGREGPADAIRASYRLAAGNPGTTLGYVVLNGLVTQVLALPAYVFAFQSAALPPDAPTFGLASLSMSAVAGVAVLGLLTGTVGTAFGAAYLVGVYRTLRGDE